MEQSGREPGTMTGAAVSTQVTDLSCETQTREDGDSIIGQGGERGEAVVAEVWTPTGHQPGHAGQMGVMNQANRGRKKPKKKKTGRGPGAPLGRGQIDGQVLQHPGSHQLPAQAYMHTAMHVSTGPAGRGVTHGPRAPTPTHHAKNGQASGPGSKPRTPQSQPAHIRGDSNDFRQRQGAPGAMSSDRPPAANGALKLVEELLSNLNLNLNRSRPDSAERVEQGVQPAMAPEEPMRLTDTARSSDVGTAGSSSILEPDRSKGVSTDPSKHADNQQRSRSLPGQKSQNAPESERHSSAAPTGPSSGTGWTLERDSVTADPTAPKAFKRSGSMGMAASVSAAPSVTAPVAAVSSDRVVCANPVGQSGMLPAVSSMMSGLPNLVAGPQKAMESSSVNIEGLVYPNGQFFPEQGPVGAAHPGLMKDRERLTFAMNNFDEKDVYIRRNNKSSMSLEGCGVGEASTSVEVPETQEGHATVSQVKAPDTKQDWRYMNGGYVPSASPTRLNFQFANGLLCGSQDKSAECHSSQAPDIVASTSSPRVGPNREAAVDMDPPTSGLGSESSQNQAGNMSRPELRSMNGWQAAVVAPTAVSTSRASASQPQPGDARPPMGATRGWEEPTNQGNRPRVDASDQQRGGGLPYGIPLPTNDLDRLLLQATPMLEVDPTKRVEKALEDLKLADVWQFYYEPSMFGREVYILGGTRGPSMAYFLPYLSAVQIFLPSDGPTDPHSYVCEINMWPQHMRLHFEHFEKKPPWYRLPMYDAVMELSKSFPDLKKLKLKKLHPASWFCVAWYPLYRIPDAPLVTRFLTFHTFHPPLVSPLANGGVVPLPVYGVEWYNMRDEPWLENVSVGPDGAEVDEEVRSLMDAAWQVHVRDLRTNAEKFARGIAFKKKYTWEDGMEDCKKHHDFEHFYKANYG